MLALVGKFTNKADYLLRFRQLSAKGKVRQNSPGHKDGWGIIHYQRGSPRYLGRFPTDAMQDERYKQACEQVAKLKDPGIVLAHFRKASLGSISEQNTQPLVLGGWGFAHNGTVWSPSFARADATSDSVVLLEKLRSAMNPSMASSSPEQSIVDAVKRVRGEILSDPDMTGRTYSSLTFLLTDGRSLYAMRDFTNPSNADYYTMHYLRLDDGVVFCQEKIVDEDWKSLADKQLAVVNPAGKVQIIKIES